MTNDDWLTKVRALLTRPAADQTRTLDVLSQPRSSASKDATRTGSSRMEPENTTKRMLTTSLADTLNIVSGGGSPSAASSAMRAVVTSLPKIGSGDPNSGFYSPVGDVMSTSRGNAKTLIHEYGHRRERNQRGVLGMLAQRILENDKRFARPDTPPPRTTELWSQEPQAVREEWQAYNRLDPYSRENANEAYAQSFTQAVNLLRDYGRMMSANGSRHNASPEEIRRVFAAELAETEARFPGTGSLLTELLSEEPYRSHPLNTMLASTARSRNVR